MAAINDLIALIQDDSLRERIQSAVDNIAEHKRFGLTFEDHLPECVPLWGLPIKKKCTVALKDSKITEQLVVVSVNDNIAKCINRKTKEIEEHSISDLVQIASFDDPIFPTLIPMGTVENAPNDKNWHTLIQSDNFHALQLLEYLYPKQVDCIYIDPPYNTGARDWKYNNDYVDSKDGWRHSKWLSMMAKRLIISKNIIKDDGVIIITIDDNEHAHLCMLLNQIFPERELFSIAIQHNPRGTQGDKFAVSHETAVYVVGKNSEIYRKEHFGNDISNFRKWGNQSKRSTTQRATTFYPIIVDHELNIVGFGDVTPLNEHPIHSNIEVNNNTYVYPIDSNGIERKWRYSKNNESEVLQYLVAKRNDEGIIEIHIYRESENTLTVWTDPLYNAEEYGTKLINKMIGTSFPFPKSLYAEHDSIWHAVAKKPNALILDFFAGSGTTLNAVNLLNKEDNGRRRCIMVTNNEVSEKEAEKLSTELGLHPGDYEWEQHGICQSVTWPRTKYSIDGFRDDGTELEGEYYTNLTHEISKCRNFIQINYIDKNDIDTASKKRNFVSLFAKGIIPQNMIKKDDKYIVSDNEHHTISVLFDESAVEEWIDALDGMDHITDFYIVTKSNKLFKSAKEKIMAALGEIIENKQVKFPMKDGFETNCAYFKLGFLEKNDVELGRSFRDILPILWLQSGAVGKCPEMSEDEMPSMLIPAENSFAVLLDEYCFADFKNEVQKRNDIDYVYIATNSSTAFTEMSAHLNVPHVSQLYRNYIENFVSNVRRNIQ